MGFGPFQFEFEMAKVTKLNGYVFYGHVLFIQTPRANPTECVGGAEMTSWGGLQCPKIHTDKNVQRSQLIIHIIFFHRFLKRRNHHVKIHHRLRRHGRRKRGAGGTRPP